MNRSDIQNNISKSASIHETAIIEDNVTIEDNVKIWHFAHVREGATISRSVSLGKSVFIDKNVCIQEFSRIQNSANIYQGVDIGKYCFIGPSVCFTNDKKPRLGLKNWQIDKTYVCDGASIGTGAVILCGLTIGSFAMIGAGACVTKSVPAFSLVVGNPARFVHAICACGQTSFSNPPSASNLISDCCIDNLDQKVLIHAETQIANTFRSQ